ncbi:hypothetical protein [Streptomyces sp. NPDC005438]|uniref:hypothetical protein n=1 Tax=Streptomyces sp. NPDC005438 TaxID=3156880 RepID=UPI0033A0D1CE
MTEETRHTPPWAVATAGLLSAVLLLVGTVSHLSDLLRHGLHPYDWAPHWLNLYWASLTVFDTLAAVLLLRRRRLGVDLACAIVTTDLAAHWYAAHHVRHAVPLSGAGEQRLAAFAVLVLATAPYLRRALPHPRQRPGE